MRMHREEAMCVLYDKWWLTRAPRVMKQWMSEHLRNVNKEIGFRLVKISQEAYEKERKRFDDTYRSNKPVSV